ncbi:hypothetical protein [Parasitella parasitica]|uniref:Uncharacterized protein n=1 Tax=Parasitella parasitica TaxID=35722 RepID=A0A0B7N1Z8_9FUNG|nr:hypothetical protein [Parasitella parasitica]
MPNWTQLSLPEYLTCVALFIVLSTILIPDTKAYWHKSDFALGPTIDFSHWMAMERFNAINKMHVFTAPDATAYAAADSISFVLFSMPASSWQIYLC